MMKLEEIKNMPQEISDADRIARMEENLLEMITIVKSMPNAGKENGPATNREPNKTVAH